MTSPLDIVTGQPFPRVIVAVEGFHVRAVIRLCDAGPVIDVDLSCEQAAALATALRNCAVRAAEARVQAIDIGGDDARRG